MTELLYTALIFAVLDLGTSVYGIHRLKLREGGFVGKQFGTLIRFLVMLALILGMYYLDSPTGMKFLIAIMFLTCAWNAAVITRKRRA